MGSRLIVRLAPVLLIGACAATPVEADRRPVLPRAAETPAATAAPTISSAPLPAMPAPPHDAEHARITRVIDGDTVVLAGIEFGDVDARTGGRRARLIGIDTPEVHGGVECLGREASAFARTTLSGAEVLVDFDVDPLDRYGRALVYLWKIDGDFFNGRIVAEGFALPSSVPPNIRYAELFARMAAEARQANRGLWSRC